MLWYVIGKPNVRHSTWIVVSPVSSRREELKDCIPWPAGSTSYCSLGECWPLLQGHAVGSCSTCCPPGPQPLYCQAAFQLVGPQLYWCAVLFLFRSRTLIFPLSFMWFPLTHCSTEISLNDSKTVCSSFEKHESFSAASWGLESIRLGTARIHSIGREQFILTCFPARAQLMS